MRLLDDPAAIGRLKYVVGGLAVICAFAFGTAAIWLDRRQMELFEQKQRPRTLTQKQQETFISTLEGSPRGEVKLQYLNTTTEAYAFAQQIHALLTSAGYDVPGDPEGALTFGPPPVGVQICSKDPDHPPPLVEPLRIAFRAIGIDAQRHRSFEQEEGVKVFIGLKE